MDKPVPTWKDDSVRGEVRSSSIKLCDDLTLLVHRHIDAPGVWHWSTQRCVSYQAMQLPEGLTLDEAKQYALARIWHRLDLMHEAIEAAQEAAP